MKLNRYSLFLLLILVLSPELALADVAFGLFGDQYPFLFLIIPFETIIFLYVFNRLFFKTNIVKKKITITYAFIIVTFANIASFFFGVLIEAFSKKMSHISHQFVIDQAIILIVAFFLSALLEWIVYIPFFLNIAAISKKWSDLFKVSIITNLIPYLLVAIILLPRPHPSRDPNRGRDNKAKYTAINFYNASMAYLADRVPDIPDEQDKIQLTPDSLPGFEVPPLFKALYDYKRGTFDLGL